MKMIFTFRLTLVFIGLLALLPPVFADDHGNTFGTATVVSVGSKTNGILEASGDLDYFRFQVTQTATYVIYSRGNTDIEGKLFNEFSSQVSSDIDDGELDNFRLELSLAPGIYYVEVSADYSGSLTGSYSFHIEGPNAGLVTDDHGYSIWSATAVTIGSKTGGALQLAGDLDYFRFQVTQAAKYVIYSRDSVNVSGYLYGEAYNSITSDTSSGELDNFRIERILGPGTYYIRIAGDYWSSTTGNYNLYIEGPGTGIVTDDHGFSVWSATAAQIGTGINGTLQVAGDLDYFQFQVVQPERYVVSSLNSVDISGYLFDSEYNLIISATNYSSLGNFRIERTLDPGTYYIGISGYYSSSTTGNYTFYIEGPAAGVNNDDHGTSVWSGTWIQPYCEKTGALNFVGDNDYFRFRIMDEMTSVIVQSKGQLDIEGRLYDVNHNQIISDLDSGEGNNFLLTRNLAPGMYYIQVRADSGGSTTGNYSILLEAGTPQGCSAIFNDKLE